jgi:hypothetical protein
VSQSVHIINAGQLPQAAPRQLAQNGEQHLALDVLLRVIRVASRRFQGTVPTEIGVLTGGVTLTRLAAFWLSPCDLNMRLGLAMTRSSVGQWERLGSTPVSGLRTTLTGGASAGAGSHIMAQQFADHPGRLFGLKQPKSLFRLQQGGHLRVMSETLAVPSTGQRNPPSDRGVMARHLTIERGLVQSHRGSGRSRQPPHGAASHEDTTRQSGAGTMAQTGNLMHTGQSALYMFCSAIDAPLQPKAHSDWS